MLPQYNGNIRVQRWGSGSSFSDQFNYLYDRLNRLSSASASAMSEQLSYDAMGNIATLNRDGAGAASYSYNGNQLSSISGGGLSTGSYSYDGNGNTTVDGRNGLTLSYNYLNQPTSATKTGTAISYLYDANGKKLRRVVTTGSSLSTDYIDGIQYSGGVIDFIQTEEGRARNVGGSYVYEYDLKDHLGNVRYSFDDNGR